MLSLCARGVLFPEFLMCIQRLRIKTRKPGKSYRVYLLFIQMRFSSTQAYVRISLLLALLADRKQRSTVAR